MISKLPLPVINDDTGRAFNISFTGPGIVAGQNDQAFGMWDDDGEFQLVLRTGE